MTMRAEYARLEGQLAIARVDCDREREQAVDEKMKSCRAEMRSVKQAGGL